MTSAPTTVRAAVVAVTVALVVALAGCSSGGSTPSGGTVTRTQTRTSTAAAPAPTFAPAPATTVARLPAGGTLPAGEVDRTCPYIRAGLDSEPTSGPNVADIEGDRVGQVTVLTRYQPVGCRFYFAYSYGDTRHEAVADILPRRFANAVDAHNALVLTATKTGTEPMSAPNFVPGVDGISYRTKFFGPDGARDWAFAFAKGTVLVVVHTQQTDSSPNAVYLAKAIVGKF